MVRQEHIYVHQKLKIRLQGLSPKVKQLTLIKEWENIIAHLKKWAKWGPGKQVWFVPKTAGGLGVSPKYILQFLASFKLGKSISST